MNEMILVFLREPALKSGSINRSELSASALSWLLFAYGPLNSLDLSSTSLQTSLFIRLGLA